MAVTVAVTKISVDGNGILGKGGKCIFGGGFSSVCISSVPSGLRRLLGGTTKGLYEGTSAVGRGKDGVCTLKVGGNFIVGNSTKAYLLL